MAVANLDCAFFFLKCHYAIILMNYKRKIESHYWHRGLRFNGSELPMRLRAHN